MGKGEMSDELKSKMRQKDQIEAEIIALSEYLQSQGVPGLHGGLVDSEGFPRADVDVHAVRSARHRLACLNTDHQALMKVIEGGLQQHLAGSGPSVNRKPATQSTPSQKPEEPVDEKPIANISEVTEGS